MKTTFKHLITFSLILIAFIFTLPLHAQGEEAGPPTVRKESQDGGTGGSSNCLSSSGEGSLRYFVSYGEDFTLPDCDLYIVIQQNQSFEYISISEDDFSVNNNNDNIFYFYVNFSAEMVDSICNGGQFYFNIKLACLGDDGFEGLDGDGDNSDSDDPGQLYPTCCPPIDTEIDPETEVDPGPDNSQLISNKSITGIELEKHHKSEVDQNFLNSTIQDYYIYDINGNPITLIKGELKEKSLQEVISKQDIHTGIYFVRYVENNTIKTVKVIKF